MDSAASASIVVLREPCGNASECAVWLFRGDHLATNLDSWCSVFVSVLFAGAGFCLGRFDLSGCFLGEMNISGRGTGDTVKGSSLDRTDVRVEHFQAMTFDIGCLCELPERLLRHVQKVPLGFCEDYEPAWGQLEHICDNRY